MHLIAYIKTLGAAGGEPRASPAARSEARTADPLPSLPLPPPKTTQPTRARERHDSSASTTARPDRRSRTNYLNAA